MNNLYFRRWLHSLVIVCSCLALHGQQAELQNSADIRFTGNPTLVLKDFTLENDGRLISDQERIILRDATDEIRIYGNGEFFISELELDLPGSALALQSDVFIGNQLIFADGLLVLDGGSAELDSDASLVNERENSRTLGFGSISIGTELVAPNSVNPGQIGLELSSSENLNDPLIVRTHTPEIIDTEGSLSIQRAFDVTAASVEADIRIYYFDGELSNQNEDSLAIFKELSFGVWEELPVTARDTSANWVETTNVIVDGKFTLAPMTGPSSVSQPLRSDLVEAAFPNPLSNRLTIQLSELANQVEIILYDAHGRQLLQAEYQNSRSIFLNIPDRLSPGTYFLSVRQGDKGTQIIPLIK